MSNRVGRPKGVKHGQGKETSRRVFIKPLQGPIEHLKFPSDLFIPGAQIFSCDICGKERIYGRAGIIPENQHPLLLCWNPAHQTERVRELEPRHYLHTFIGIFSHPPAYLRLPEEFNRRWM